MRFILCFLAAMASVPASAEKLTLERIHADPALAGQMHGPDTVDGIAPAGTWSTWWQERVAAKRASAPWIAQPASSETVSAK